MVEFRNCFKHSRDDGRFVELIYSWSSTFIMLIADSEYKSGEGTVQDQFLLCDKTEQECLDAKEPKDPTIAEIVYVTYIQR